jgi:hypothetical protein
VSDRSRRVHVLAAGLTGMLADVRTNVLADSVADACSPG